MSTVQSQIQEDWNNREFVETITSSIKKISEFLNAFDLSARSRLAMLNQKLTAVNSLVCTVLWLAGGDSLYLEDSIKEFSFTHSTFDLVSKLIFARAQNDHFQNGILQSQMVANGHRNYLCLVKGVC